MVDKNKKIVVLVAGGTGGHTSPALALGSVLLEHGYTIHFMTDERGGKRNLPLKIERIYQLPASTITLSWRNIFNIPRQISTVLSGYYWAKKFLKDIIAQNTCVVVGFGGYPSLAPLIAAQRLGIATCIHEQNAVMGKANRIAAKNATLIATSFKNIHLLPAKVSQKVHLVGNPVRPNVLEHATTPYPAISADQPFYLTVFGGSQGATFLSTMIPDLVDRLPKAVSSRLNLTIQCPQKDVETLKAHAFPKMENLTIQAYYDDLPAYIAKSHLVICRSGASSIWELATIGRPSFLVPLPSSLEGDQLHNAKQFTKTGSGWIIDERTFDIEKFVNLFTRLVYNETELKNAANSAHAFAKPDAALNLASEVENLFKIQKQ